MNMPAIQTRPLVIQWNHVLLEAIRLSRCSLPVAARAVAMVHTAIYDAWSVYSKCAFSTTTSRYIKRHGEGCGDNEVERTYSYAAYRVLTDLFWLVLPAEHKNMFRDLMKSCQYDPDDCSVDTITAAGIGNLVARLVTGGRAGDGSNTAGLLYHFAPFEDYTGYQPFNPPQPSRVKDVNHWQPLAVNGNAQQCLLPHWGLVRPFALVFARQFRPGPPHSTKEPADFRKQAQEIIAASELLSDKEKAIAEYWSDGPGTYTSAGHWCEIAQFICEREKYGTRDCVKLFFALGNALLDASISCWECKRRYDSVRPITAIQELYKGKRIRAWGGPYKGTVEMDGKDWRPYQLPEVVTPPFAEHVSAQSTLGRAAAFILEAYTKSDCMDGCFQVKKGSSRIEPGKTPATDILLDWPTFTAAAGEAGLSGIYGGIHFKNGQAAGQQLGESVGKCVWDKALLYFND